MMCVPCYFFNFCVSSVSCTAVPLWLLPAEMSGWSWLLVQRAPPAANEVKLHVHASRLAMCLHACRTWGLVSELCLPIRPVSVRPTASCECSFAIWITAASHWLAGWQPMAGRGTRYLWVALTPLSLSALTPGDETYHDIFRDFSHMASNNPEKLKRRSADPKM